MGTDIMPGAGTAAGAIHPTARRFLQMVGRPDLRSEFPEQFEKHWENKGLSGRVQILQFRMVNHPCEVIFSLFFNGEEVMQTGIVIKYQGEALLNEVQKGDSLNYMATKRIDPVAFLKMNYPHAGPGLPVESRSFTLAVDEDSEPEVLRAVMQQTGKSEHELQAIWQGLIQTNEQRPGKDRVSPIIKTWLKKERDRIDLQFLRFAQLLLPRSGNVMQFTSGTHTCVVAVKKMLGSQIKEMADAVEPEWWGGMFFGFNQGNLVRMPHDQKDRLLALDGFDHKFEFPVEEIFIDGRQIYAVIFVGEEALVWRTLHQRAPDSPEMPSVAPAAAPKGEGLMARLKGSAAEPEAELVVEEPAGPPEAHPYLVARAEKAYMRSLRGRLAELKGHRREYLRLLYESDGRRFRGNPAALCAEVQGAIEKALGRDAAGIQREAVLVEAYAMVFYDETESS